MSMSALSRNAPHVALTASRTGARVLIFDLIGVWKSKACGKPRFLPMDNQGNQNPMSSAALPRAFDKCSVLEIKNSALFLAFAFQDIKDIKRRISIPRAGDDCRELAFASPFENSTNELKEGQSARSGNGLWKRGKAW